MKEFVPLILSLVFQRHPTWQVHMNMGSLMGIWVKWHPFSPLTKAPSELKYQCGRRYIKLCYPQLRLSAIRGAEGLLLLLPLMGIINRE